MKPNTKATNMNTSRSLVPAGLLVLGVALAVPGAVNGQNVPDSLSFSSSIQLLSPGHEWWLATSDADAVDVEAPTFEWVSTRAFKVYEVSIWDVAHTTVIHKSFVEGQDSFSPRVDAGLISMETSIGGLPTCTILEWQVAGGIGTTSFNWVHGPDGKQFYITDGAAPACGGGPPEFGPMDFGPVRAFVTLMPDPVYGFGSSMGGASSSRDYIAPDSQASFAITSEHGVPELNLDPAPMSAGGGGGGGQYEGPGQTMEARCFEWHGSNYDWCYGKAPDYGYVDVIGIIYCPMDSGDCETSGTIHTNAQHTYGYCCGDPYSGVWTFWSQFYSGGNTGCPDPNGCNYGTPGQTVDAVTGTMGAAIYPYNIGNYMSGSYCYPTYYGSTDYLCDGQGGYGGWLQTHST